MGFGSWEYRTLDGKNALGTQVARDDKEIMLYFSRSAGKGISLIEGNPKGNAIWRGEVVPRNVGPEERNSYYRYFYLIEDVASGDPPNQYITVSSQATILKDRLGEGLELYPLTLGEKKDAAEFEFIRFSGR